MTGSLADSITEKATTLRLRAALRLRWRRHRSPARTQAVRASTRRRRAAAALIFNQHGEVLPSPTGARL